MESRSFLAKVHRRAAARRCLQLGIGRGETLALVRCPTVAVDPDYAIEAELRTPVELYRTHSDDFFNRVAPVEPEDDHRFDLTVIDGPRLCEVALREVINAERWSTARGMIIIVNALPRTVEQAARVPGQDWVGDSYQLLAALATWRPDLIVVSVDTEPHPTIMITGLDPTNTVLTSTYARIVSEFRTTDPQPVPTDLLDRLTLQPPSRVVASDLLSVLATAPAQVTPAEVRERLAGVLAESLGVTYAR